MKKLAVPAQQVQGIFYILAAGLIWGTLPLVLEHIDGAFTIKVFFRLFFPLIVLTIYLAVTGKLKAVLAVSKEDERRMVLQGMILGFNWILFLGAFELANVSVVELLGYMGPVFTAILAPLVLKERFDRRIIAPLIFAMVGMVIILIPHGLDIEKNGLALLGVAMAAASAVTYAVLILNEKGILDRNTPTTTLLFYEYAAGSILLFPFVLWAYGHGQGPTGGLTSYGWLFVLGIVHTGLALVLFFQGLKRLRADRAVVFTYAEPVTAIIMAAVFLNQPITAYTLVGGALVVVGGTIVSRLDVDEGIEIVPVEAGGQGDPLAHTHESRATDEH